MMISGAFYSGVASIHSGMKLMDGSAQTIARQAMTSPDSSNQTTSSSVSGTSEYISPTGDLTHALVEQRQALYQVQAGAKIIQTSDKALGGLLDAFA